MGDGQFQIMDGNEAAASVAYRASEIIAIYPITPASAMGELSDEWAAHGRKNLWDLVPRIVEMQSEGGAAGTVHGALQAGALTTTFTASQGLLLMIPNLYKIAGELNACCLHVAARTLATHALSIFGDHSDVMACRGTGFAMLASASVQQAHDFACIAHAATLETRVPFMHFFDGFRTSHELGKVDVLPDELLRAMLDGNAIEAHRRRALTPDHPVMRGTAQNPDTYFQAREASNPFYLACPSVVEAVMARFADKTGRAYRLFEYFGDAQAERVIIAMGSSTETIRETVQALVARGEKVGALAVRLFRPFSIEHFIAALPVSTRSIAVLDRTKEPGAPAEPLHLDVLAALDEGFRGGRPTVIGGRYGLSSKELTPGMVVAVFEELAKADPRRRFTLGIVDDITQLSLPIPQPYHILPAGTYEALFYGLGADGTVGANKNTIKIVGARTALWPQGYFVYDSKKSGSMTVSHLRFGPRALGAPYLIEQADFVAIHQFELFERVEMLTRVKDGGVLLINTPYAADALWEHLPLTAQQQIIDRKLTVYAVDAHRIAREAGLGGRINTVMQVCFFALSKLLPMDVAMSEIREALESSYGKKGGEIVRMNLVAADKAVAALSPMRVPAQTTSRGSREPTVPSQAPDFVRRVTSAIIEGHGDLLPVSAFAPDGTWPTATSQWEKRNIAFEIPIWDEKICIQCNKCVLLCPHAAIRAKVCEPSALVSAPTAFQHADFRSPDMIGMKYTLKVAPEDCTGCQLCVEVCPARDKANPRHKALEMAPQRPIRDAVREQYEFFLGLPEVDRTKVRHDVKHLQLLRPLFEYSGACGGCGETPYLKLLTQLFGDRILIANATGCSSIYGGNLPTTPYAVDAQGRGPAWSNSLFEDNAEFGLGMRLAVDALRARAQALLARLSSELGDELVAGLLGAPRGGEQEIAEQRARVLALREKLVRSSHPQAGELLLLADYLVDKSIWLVGGDGWAYDIGFGGLDHVLASGLNVNVLVLDTEVYSNTGGQQSKATPLGASAKFAAAGKATAKKDLGLIAMSYEHVYVAQVAIGAKDNQTVSAFVEAERHEGPSLIIAYSHCIAHGYDLMNGATQQRLAVESGVWPLYRYDPAHIPLGEAPLHLDAAAPKRSVREYMRNEARFRMVEQLDPARFAWLEREAQRQASRRVEHYRQLSELRTEKTPAGPEET